MNNLGIIIGNLCSLVGMFTDSFSSSRKTARGVLLVQTLTQAIYGAGAIALKGYSAAVQNAVSVLRNLAAIGQKQSKFIEWLLVILGVVLGLAFNNLGVIGLLPVIANLAYSLAVFRFQNNERALKMAFLFTSLLYALFNGFILNIVGAITNSVIIVMTVLFLIRDGRQSK